jgi:uncharacterized protein YjbI with pentapeptide repeats
MYLITEGRGYLRGDEELEFRNLHPTHPLYRSRLPGLRARAFVRIEVPTNEPEFREVTLNLDTLWIDIEAEKLALVWRGLTPVHSLKLKEITHLAALTEPLDSPLQSKDEMGEWMLQRVREEREGGPPTPEEVAEEAAAKASWETFEKETAEMDKEEVELEKEFQSLDDKVAKQLQQEKARLVADGIDPKVLEELPKPQTLAELKTQLAAEIARLAETDPQAAAKFAGVEKELDELEKMDQEFAALEAEESPPPTRESVQADIAQGKAVKGADLCGQDLSNLDLSGADFSETNLAGTNLVGARLVGTDFNEANLAGADLSEASLDGADFSKAQLRGAKFSGASVEGSSFSELELPSADFSGCKGRHADFSGSNLERANFSGAKLPHANFCGANVKGANFLGAELAMADFGGASGAGINMEKADLTNLRAGEKADFTGGEFREAKAPKSIWEAAQLDRADFCRAVLTDALFEDASVKETRFDRADLTKASFEGASC